MNLSITTLMTYLLASTSDNHSSSRGSTSSGIRSEAATMTPQLGIIGNDILSKIGWYETTYTVTMTLCHYTGKSTNSSYCGPISSAQPTNSIPSTEIAFTIVETAQSKPDSSSPAPSPHTTPPGVSNDTNTMIPEKPNPPYANQTWIQSSIESPSPTPHTSYGMGTTTATSRSGNSDGFGSSGSSGGSSGSGSSGSTRSSDSTRESGSNGGSSSSRNAMKATSSQINLQPSSTIHVPPQETDSLAHRVKADRKDAMAFWAAVSAVMLLELGINLPYWI